MLVGGGWNLSASGGVRRKSFCVSFPPPPVPPPFLPSSCLYNQYIDQPHFSSPSSFRIFFSSTSPCPSFLPFITSTSTPPSLISPTPRSSYLSLFSPLPPCNLRPFFHSFSTFSTPNPANHPPTCSLPLPVIPTGPRQLLSIDMGTDFNVLSVASVVAQDVMKAAWQKNIGYTYICRSICMYKIRFLD